MTPPQGSLLGDPAASIARPRPPARDAGGRDGKAAPRLAQGLELVGAMAGSGYRDAPCLVRRADGQTIQLTSTLYHVLESIDGQRDAAAIGRVLAERHRLGIEPDDVEFLLEAKLRPLGVLEEPDGEPVAARSNPLLALRGRVAMVGPEATGRLAARFLALFRPVVVVPVLVAFTVSTWWLLGEHGLGDAVRTVLYEPGALLLVIALTLASAAFHELGHAAACRYGGARPGGIGAALYLVWPAFYTDVTDSYRLDRWGRLRVDLGGLYFNAVASVAAWAVWAVVRWDALLAVMFLQVVQMLRQLVPLVRFDGYHVLADLVGVPDLFARIKPVLLGLLPTRWGRADSRVLKPWARLVITLWVAVVVPILALSLLLMVVTLPRLVATAWDSLGLQWQQLVARWSEADVARTLLGVISLVTIALPVCSVAYLLARIVRRWTRRIWRASAGDPALRVATVAAAAALLIAGTAAWWPHGQYRPIQSGDELTVPATAADLVALGAGGESAVLASHVAATELPERPADPWLPVGSRTSSEAARSPAPSTLRPRATFTPPPAPGHDGNQALAVNYGDGSSVFDVALSLLWATEDDVLPVNQAYALASCAHCRTMAVAFQLVLVLGDADVVAPRNEAVAVNVLCDQCVTRALAVQLLLTLVTEPDPAMLQSLADIWNRLDAVASALDAETPIEDVAASLAAVEAEVVALLAPVTASIARDVTEPSPEDGSTEPAVDGTTTTTEPDGTTTSTSEPSSEEPPMTTTTTSPEPTTTTTTTEPSSP